MKGFITKTITQFKDIKTLLGWYIYSISVSNNKQKLVEINNKTKRNIFEAIQYIINTVKETIEFLPNKSISDLRDKTILEIGPGQDIGVVLTLLGLGTKKVYLVDPFFAEWKDEIHLNYYNELLKTVKVEFPNHNFDALSEVCKIKSYNIKEIVIVRSGLEHAEIIPNNEIDISFSNACFEHFYDTKKAIRELSRITNLGGIGFHQVDLRDHRDYSKPLEFLTMSDFLFSKYSKYSNCCSGNRVRHYEYINYFKGNGFECTFSPNMFTTEEYLTEVSERINKKYKNVDLGELKPISGRFFIEKIGAKNTQIEVKVLK